MIESYHLEIIRKRRAARLFWLIVFVCSFFLYYFFQGYYPDISLGMRRIFSESGSESASGSSDLIRSFGIINVRATPENATIHLGSGNYNNNDKKMSDYGDYLMEIENEGYLANTMEFRIDREKPFFIEKVSLLPNPTYREQPRVTAVYQITDDTYIIRTASGLIWSGATMTGRVNYSGALEQIGGVHFKTDTGTLRWATSGFMPADSYIQDYIDTCPHVEWISELFYCPRVGSVLTEGHQYMTGVIDISRGLIARNGSITEISDGNIGKKWSQTGTIDLSKMIRIDGELYTSNSGILTPLDPKSEPISLPLDHIISATLLADDTIFIGERDGVSHLIIRHSGDPIDRTRDIILPSQLSYEDIRFHALSGNIAIGTSRGILFIYRGSSEVHWLVEGEILSYSPDGATYRKDGKIWWADWSK